MMHPDAALDEVRDIKRKISERFGDDPKRVLEYYRAFQRDLASRLSEPPTPEGAAPSDQAGD